MKYYCLSCKKQVEPSAEAGVEEFKSKNGRDMVRTACGECGRTLTSFKKKQVAAENEQNNSSLSQNGDAAGGQSIQVSIQRDQGAGESVYTGEQ